MSRAGRLTYAALAAAGDMVSITTVDEGAVCTAMLDLYQNEGIIAEPAGALAVAGLLESGIEPGSTVVCLVSGGNNDVSRYGEVLERSLVHLGLKHYFLVDFPQEPGALRRFLDGVLGPHDDITLFEYVKRNNRETGEALVGIELGSPPAWTACWSECGRPRCRSKPSNPARRPTATCCRRVRGSGAAHRIASTAAFASANPAPVMLRYSLIAAIMLPARASATTAVGIPEVLASAKGT